MPDSSTLLLALLYLLILSQLVLLWRTPRQRVISFFRRLTNARNTRFEQTLLQEVVAACTNTSDLHDLIVIIGKHAASSLEADAWLLAFKADKEKHLNIAPSSGLTASDTAKESLISGPLEKWLRSNSDPLYLTTREFGKSGLLDASLFPPETKAVLVLPLVSSEITAACLLCWTHRQRSTPVSGEFLTLFIAVTTEFLKKGLSHHRQQESLKAQARTEKMAALGNLASAVAHEIRNPLTFIRAAGEQILRDETLAEKHSPLLEGILEESDRIDDQIQKLLSLARPAQEEFSQLCLGDVMQKVVRLIEPKARDSNVSLHCDFQDKNSPIHGSAGQISQVVLNLCLNALQAISGAGEITLTTRRMGNRVFIDIIDTGCGIPAEQAERIFEPFFSTKEDGTGLGLATSFKLIQSHGGSLRLLSSSPQGSHFEISLPVPPAAEEE